MPVTVVHHDDGAGTNKLDAARQALREQIAARERTERGLEEARLTIQTLETQLAHERMARDEAVRRVEDERQAVERQLVEERAARQRVERERDEAIADRQEVEERLREVLAAQEAQQPSTASVRAKQGKKARGTIDRSDASELETPIMPAARSADGAPNVKQFRRRGPPAQSPATGIRCRRMVGAGMEGAASVGLMQVNAWELVGM